MEKQFIQWLKSKTIRGQSVRLGIGDDASVLEPIEGQTVVTVDTIVDGVHFDSKNHSPERIGYKALAVNLSDLAAMGAMPVACLMSLTVRPETDLEFCQKLANGMIALGDRNDCPLVGGDFVVATGAISVSVTAIGRSQTESFWQISTAKVGDSIWVTGPLGGSILGHHLDFQPRTDIASALNGNPTIHAVTDISDGLAIDLSTICESSGVGAVLELEKIPVSEAAFEISKESEKSPMDHALYDGEDFELILIVDGKLTQSTDAISEFQMPGPITKIGTIVQESGLWHEQTGKRSPIAVEGYVHGQQN